SLTVSSASRSSKAASSVSSRRRYPSTSSSNPVRAMARRITSSTLGHRSVVRVSPVRAPTHFLRSSKTCRVTVMSVALFHYALPESQGKCGRPGRGDQRTEVEQGHEPIGHSHHHHDQSGVARARHELLDLFGRGGIPDDKVKGSIETQCERPAACPRLDDDQVVRGLHGLEWKTKPCAEVNDRDDGAAQVEHPLDEGRLQRQR